MTAAPDERRTVAAIVTPIGEGGIGVIEIVGPRALDAVAAVFQPKGVGDPRCAQPGSLLYGHVVADGHVVDEVLVHVAGDERAEINCHGGVVPTRRVLSCLTGVGATAVNAAELLERGGLDVIQTEAARELLTARSRLAARVLLDQQAGELSGTIRRLIDGDACVERIDALLATAPFGMALCRPPKLVIAGRPNVGKSTLFNGLLQQERAIATPIPGTTRDYLVETIVLDGMPFELVDTAGIRETDHVVEIEGVKGARAQLSQAAVVLLVLDRSEPLRAEDSALIDELRGFVTVPVLNKIDLPGALDEGRIAAEFEIGPHLISAATGDGLAELMRTIARLPAGGYRYHGPAPIVFTDRQRGALTGAGNALASGDTDWRRHLAACLGL